MSDTSTATDAPAGEQSTESQQPQERAGERQLRERGDRLEAEVKALREQVRGSLVQRVGLDMNLPWVAQLVQGYQGELTEDAFRKWAAEDMKLPLDAPAAKGNDSPEAPKPPTELDPARQAFQERRNHVQDSSSPTVEQVPWDDFKQALDDPDRQESAIAAFKAGKVAVPPHLLKAAGLRP